MEIPWIDIHTHRPTGRATELRASGVHPWAADDANPDALPDPAPDVQAVGEIGLDYARPTDRARQERLFRAQLAQACRLRLPVVLHVVRAFEPAMRILEGYELRAVIFHGFIGSPEQAARAYARGYYLSFGRRSLASPRTVAALRAAPAERIFCETDDDGIDIRTVYARIATLRGVTTDELRLSIYENYLRIFSENDG